MAKGFEDPFIQKKYTSGKWPPKEDTQEFESFEKCKSNPERDPLRAF